MSIDHSVNFQLCSSLIETSNCEKMLGVKIDCKHDFDETSYSKAYNKMRALTRATPYMRVETKKKILMNSFFLSTV